MEDTQYEPNFKQKTSKIKILFVLCVASLIVVVSLYAITIKLNSPSPEFPIAGEIRITEGLNQNEIHALLESKNIIRSSYYAHFIFLLNHKESFIQAGTYSFETPLRTDEILRALVMGEHITPIHKITFPEGFQTKNIELYLKMPITDEMRALVTSYEGYLFPDTYHVSSDSSFLEIMSLLNQTFEARIAEYDTEISQSSFTKDEVIILASLIEREANDAESKSIISGILQSRLTINMPLQVDATFDYFLNKTSAELTQDDLQMDSPYNTYTRTGLPPTPIANPGIESIEAVLKPTKTAYLYYLTGTDGTFHYAKTFEEHKRNKILYLQ